MHSTYLKIIVNTTDGNLAQYVKLSNLPIFKGSISCTLYLLNM